LDLRFDHVQIFAQQGYRVARRSIQTPKRHARTGPLVGCLANKFLPETTISHAECEYESEIRFCEAAGENIQAIRDLFSRRECRCMATTRMLKFGSPTIASYPNAHWLTIGDDGADVWILRSCGAKAFTASFIYDAWLKKSERVGVCKKH
jgi:hypothetical protein